jgi:flagella basal body P-ring formation protein FlgA
MTIRFWLVRSMLGAIPFAIFPGSLQAQDVWQAPAAAGPRPASVVTDAPWPALNRAVERGQVFTEQDFVTQTTQARATSGLLPLDAIIGKAAARAIPEGAFLRASDVIEQQLVYRGAPVTLRVQIGGILITSTGRALADGRMGMPVRVFSDVSNRTVDAVVQGPAIVNLAGY